MRENIQKVSLSSAVILFLVSISIFIFMYMKINSSNTQTTSNRNAWLEEYNKRGHMADLEQSLRQIASQRALLDTHFAKRSDVVPFFNAMDETLAPLTGVKANIVSVDTGTSNNQMIINLEASGSFESVYKYLTLLENSAYELDFQTVDMHSSLYGGGVAPTSVQNSTWQATFKIQLLSFIQS